jgi:predicted amidohydrolase
MSKTVTVALVQSRPVFMNLEASLAKAAAQIGEAASRGARLVVFGETWLAGYPAWLDYCPEAALWNYEPTKQVYARLRQNSIVVPSPETELLAKVAGENNVTVVIGVNERVEKGVGNGTLYNSLLTFSNEGKLVNHHRKLVPTFTERLVWGHGDADGLDAVDTSAGRVGGLVCWEHWMPLARQTMHNAGEQIHVSVFPTVHEMHQIASRHYAFEGRCFVLTIGLIMPVKDLPSEMKTSAELAQNPDGLLLKGGSAVIAPDGRYVAGPVYDEETILIAEIDLSEIDKEKMTLDVSGHYQRPDVFELSLKKGSRIKL